MEKINIKNLDIKELEQLLISWQIKPFHAKQIFSWIYHKRITEFDKMSDLSSALRDKLNSNCFVSELKMIKEQISSDGTKKYLFELNDKNLIESVAIPAEGRLTGCISSQVGCKFGCVFCSSAVSGFKRNLSVFEILDQVMYIANNSLEDRLSNLVFMGMGEPFDNYDNVLKAIRIINSRESINIGARKICISTSGVIPGIEKLAQEDLQIELSISLHAADDKTRSKLMPINKKYYLKDLMNTCRKYIEYTNRQITFEYIMISGVNVDVPSANKLSLLLRGLNCKVNLIAFNPNPKCDYLPPNKLDFLMFKDVLVKNGIVVMLRKSRGQDIEAACGQLKLRYEENL